MIYVGIPFPHGFRYLTGEGNFMPVVLGIGVLEMLLFRWYGKWGGQAAQSGSLGAMMFWYLILLALRI